MKQLKSLSAAIGLIIFSGCALSQTARADTKSVEGFYAGGSIGAFGAYGELKNAVNAPLNQSKDSTGYKLYGGYQLNENFGAELGRLGASSIKRSYVIGGANVSQSGKITSHYIAATGRLPINDRFALNSRLGIASSKFSGTNSLPAGSSILGSKTGVLIGVGAAYRFTPNIAGTVDYDHLPKTSPSLKSGLLSAGVKYSF